MPNSLQMQSPKLISGYVNGEDLESPGVPLTSPSGMIVPNYPGFVGTKLWISEEDAAKLSNPAIGTLFAGGYQYVKFKEAVVRGQIVYWDIAEDYAAFQVTKDATAVPTAVYKAGIVLRTQTAGRYGYIQIAGLASVLFRAVLTSPGAIGSIVVTADDASAAADVLAGAGAATLLDVANMLARNLGVAQTAPVGGAIAVVGLAPMMDRQ